jgi:hypothetical protein
VGSISPPKPASSDKSQPSDRWQLSSSKSELTYATDDLGQRPVQDIHPLYHFNATILHLLGLDFERLSFEHNGIQRRLTKVEGKIIPEILAEIL